jgi:capsule polysaccharide export protein KpsE/RkpR
MNHVEDKNDVGTAVGVVLSALFDRFRLVLVCCGTGLFLSGAIAFMIPSEYRSEVQMMPPGWQSTASPLMTSLSGISAATGGAGLGAGLLGARSVGGPLIGIVESRTAEDDLITRFDLQRVYHVKTHEDARKILRERTEAGEDKPTGIISIIVTDHDPSQARDLAAAYVDELNKLVVAMDTSAAHRERVFLDERLKQVQKDLESSEQQLSQFSSRTGTMNAEAQSKVMLDATSRLQGELIAAESELHGLQAIYSNDNVRVEAAKARVNTLNGELQKMEGSPTSASGSGELYPSLRQLPLFGATYADLYRRTKVQETAFELLSREVEVAKVQEAKEIPNVKVLDPPVIAERRSSPPRVLMIGSGALLGLLVGIGLVIAREVWDRMDNSEPVKGIVISLRNALRERRNEYQTWR